MPQDEKNSHGHLDRKTSGSSNTRKITRFLGITDNSIDEANMLDKSSKAIKILGLNDSELNKKSISLDKVVSEFRGNSRSNSLNSVSNGVGGSVIVASIRKHVVHKGYLSKHTNTNFVLSKSWKKRYFVLAKSILYCFKSNDATSNLIDSFELTCDTVVCVSDVFSGKAWILEVSKPNIKAWYLQADNVKALKSWLTELKSIVVKLKYNDTELPSNINSATSINLIKINSNDSHGYKNNSDTNKSKNHINIINNISNGSNTGINKINNSSNTTSVVNSPINESYNEELFFTPKTSISNTSFVQIEKGDDSDKVIPTTPLPPPPRHGMIITPLSPAPRPRSQSSSSSSPTTDLSSSPRPLSPYMMMSNTMTIDEEMPNNENENKRLQSDEPIKRPSSPIESLSPPLKKIGQAIRQLPNLNNSTNNNNNNNYNYNYNGNLSSPTTMTTMTLEQRRRRRSNSAESLEINILPSRKYNNYYNNDHNNQSIPSPKGSIGSHHSDSDKRNSTRQSNPIVMPSWSVKTTSTNMILTSDNNNNNKINSSDENNNIMLMTPLSPPPRASPKFQRPTLSERSISQDDKSSNTQIDNKTSRRLLRLSSLPNSYETTTIHDEIVSFASPTNDDNIQPPPQKTKKRRNKNKNKPITQSSSLLSTSASTSSLNSLKRISITEEDVKLNNMLIMKSQSQSSSSTSLSSSTSTSTSSSTSTSTRSSPPSQPSLTPSTPLTPSTSYSNSTSLPHRLHYNHRSSFVDFPNKPIPQLLPARSKSQPHYTISKKFLRRHFSLTTVDIKSLPPPTRPPNVPLPPIPQNQQELDSQSQSQSESQSRLQNESIAEIQSQPPPSSISKSTPKETNNDSLIDSKEKFATNYTDEDNIDPYYAKELSASLNNNKIEKIVENEENEVEKVSSSETPYDDNQKDDIIEEDITKLPASELTFVVVEETNGDGEIILNLQDVNEINSNNNDDNEDSSGSVKRVIKDDFDVISGKANHNNNLLVT